MKDWFDKYWLFVWAFSFSFVPLSWVINDAARERARTDPSTILLKPGTRLNIRAGEGGDGTSGSVPGYGGDLIFTAGRGGVASNGQRSLPRFGGQIRFLLPDGTELMHIAPEGDVYVHKHLVTNDREVFDGFSAWLYDAGALSQASSMQEQSQCRGARTKEIVK